MGDRPPAHFEKTETAYTTWPPLVCGRAPPCRQDVFLGVVEVEAVGAPCLLQGVLALLMVAVYPAEDKELLVVCTLCIQTTWHTRITIECMAEKSSQ